MDVTDKIRNKIWFEKYRPKTIDDLVLPDKIKNELQGYLKNGDIPNLLFYSPGGMGKTSAAIVMIEQLGMDYIEINGSIDTSIEMVRNRILNFSSKNSLMVDSEKPKCIFVTEADGFSEHAKNAMKNIIEKFSDNIRFIFDTNYVDKLSQPIRSRCVEIDFNFDKSEYPSLMKGMLQRCCKILEENDVTYEKRDVANLIKHRFPDMRKIINDLQKSSITGDFVPVNNSPEEQFEFLIQSIKDKNFDTLRKIVKDISDNGADSVILRLYNRLEDIFTKESLVKAILIIGDYQNKSMSCVSKEINLLSMILELMKNTKLKD